MLLGKGSKVIVTYSKDNIKKGIITGETPKMWKITFGGEKKETRVKKTMDIKIVLEGDPTYINKKLTFKEKIERLFQGFKQKN